MAEGGVNFSDIDHSTIQAETIVGGNYTVIQQLVKGPDKLPTDYSTRIKNFLREYLGDEKNKVPFGGRAADFATMNQWLADPDTPSCLFMSAEAGRGKSALLVRWASYLQQFEDLQVVFLPISIRFETAAQEVFYTALAARLATVYGDEVKYSQLSAEQWKGVADQYLQKVPPDGKRVVVIIDGLDEATGWQPGAAFVPLPLPAGVRVVVSKRVQAEENMEVNLRQLGWQMQDTATHVTLVPLTRNGVEDVLIQMGNPLEALVTKVNVIGELFRLTEGDPLLVRLYVDALVGQRKQVATLTAEQLQDIEPGLEGYFDQWWEDQYQKWEKEKRNPLEADKVLGFFNAVATSFGPLSKKDILEITKAEKISGVQLKGIAKEVGRFIIGDGEVVGYRFSHPRLGYYFFDQLGYKEKEDWNTKFVEYGQMFLKKIKEQKKIIWSTEDIEPHAYILQHYTAHLDRANALHSDYYALICHEWAQAWEALRGTYDGFLVDVGRIWQKAESDSDPIEGMKMQIWCALCQSSIVALSSNMPPELLAGATEAGVLSKARALVLLNQNSSNEKNIAKTIELLAQNVEMDEEFAKQLLEIAQYIRDKDLLADSLHLLAPYQPHNVLQLALGIEQEWKHQEVLLAVIPYLPNEVVEVIRSIENCRYRADLLIALAAHLPESERSAIYEEALEVARGMEDIWGWEIAEVLIALASHIPRLVLDAARELRNEWSRMKVLIKLATYLPENQRIAVYEETLELAREITHERFRAEQLIKLCAYLPEERRGTIYQEALEIARSIGHKKDQAETLIALSTYLPEGERKLVYEEALEVTMTIVSEQTEVLVVLAPHLPDETLRVLYYHALELAEDIGQWGRAKILVELAAHLPEVERKAVYQKALEMAWGLEDGWGRAEALTTLAAHLPEEERRMVYQEALKAAGKVLSQEKRAEVLVTLAAYHPEVVLDVTRRITEEEYRTKVLIALVTYQPKEVLNEARKINFDGDKAEILVALTSYLPQEVLEVARGMQDERYRAKVLIGLATYQPKGVLEVARGLSDRMRRIVLNKLSSQLTKDVLQAARELEDRRWRAEVLTALAPYLPEGEREVTYKEALQAAWGIVDIEWYAEVLFVLAKYLSEDQRAIVYQEVLEVTQRIEHEKWRAELLGALATHFPEEVLQAARQLRDESERKWVFRALVANQSKKVLEAAGELKDEGDRTDVLEKVAPYQPRGVLEAARKLQDGSSRVKVLSILAPYLPEEERNPVYQEALEVAREMADGYGRVVALFRLASCLPQEVLEAIGELKDEENRADVLVALAPYKSGKVLEVAQGIQDEGSRAKVLVALAAYQPEEVLEAAHGLQNEEERAEVLIAVVPYILEGERRAIYQEALEATQEVRNIEKRVRVLIAVAVHLPEEVLRMAQEIEDEGSRAKVLVALAAYQSEAVLKIAEMLPDWQSRAEVLIAVAPYLAENKQMLVYQEALKAAREATRKATQDWIVGMRFWSIDVLSAFANSIPQVVLEEAWTIGDERYYAHILANVAPHLIKAMKQSGQNPMVEWHRAIGLVSRQPRRRSLIHLGALMPFTLALVEENTPSPATKPLTLTDDQRKKLLTFFEDLILLDKLTRVQFLEDAGLKKLTPYLQFDVPQSVFVRNLLDTCITFGIEIDTGIPYLTKLLHHLKDTVWAGQPEPRTFVETLLGTPPATPAQQRLAEGILEAVQSVCSWWP